MTTRTPNYDPRNNSSIINFLLTSWDGKYVRKPPPSDCDLDALFTKSITLGQFPLFTKTVANVSGGLSVVAGATSIAGIVCSAVYPEKLAITIPITIISILFSGFFGSIYYYSPGAQHRFVLVELDCRKCDEDHPVLYDCITKQKRRRLGLYTNEACSDMQISTDKIAYSKVFEEMRNQLAPAYNPFGYNCQDWADEFYVKSTTV